MALVPVTGLEIDLPPCDDETARAEAARAHERIDALPDVAYDDTLIVAAQSALEARVATLEGKPDDDTDDTARANLATLTTRVANLESRPTGTGSGAPDPENAILLDAMSGANDDAKLDAAWSIAQASNPRRPIRLAARNHTFTKTRTTFSGLRILGPNTGWQNPEIGGTSGALPQCNVTLNIANSGFWLVGTGTTYDVTVSGLCFKSGNASSFYHHPYSAGTC